MTTKINIDRFVWIDLETFGLNPAKDPILEVGIVITDAHLKITSEFHKLIWERPWYANLYDEMVKTQPESWVLKTHEKSGLWEACQKYGSLEARAARDTLEFLEKYSVGKDDALCGNSVHFDRMMLASWWPEVERVFSYRNIDISTVRELAARWKPAVYEKFLADRPVEIHRVIPDIDACIAEANLYAGEFFLLSSSDQGHGHGPFSGWAAQSKSRRGK